MTTETKDRRLARQLAEELRKEGGILDEAMYHFGDIDVVVTRVQKPVPRLKDIEHEFK